MSNEIPEGYELAENSAAKDFAMEALYAEFERQGVDVDADSGDMIIDMIDLADTVVEALLKVGITIPGDLESPYGSAK